MRLTTGKCAQSGRKEGRQRDICLATRSHSLAHLGLSLSPLLCTPFGASYYRIVGWMPGYLADHVLVPLLQPLVPLHSTIHLALNNFSLHNSGRHVREGPVCKGCPLVLSQTLSAISGLQNFTHGHMVRYVWLMPSHWVHPLIWTRRTSKQLRGAVEKELTFIWSRLRADFDAESTESERAGPTHFHFHLHSNASCSRPELNPFRFAFSVASASAIAIGIPPFSLPLLMLMLMLITISHSFLIIWSACQSVSQLVSQSVIQLGWLGGLGILALLFSWLSSGWGRSLHFVPLLSSPGCVCLAFLLTYSLANSIMSDLNARWRVGPAAAYMCVYQIDFGQTFAAFVTEIEKRLPVGTPLKLQLKVPLPLRTPSFFIFFFLRFQRGMRWQKLWKLFCHCTCQHNFLLVLCASPLTHFDVSCQCRPANLQGASVSAKQLHKIDE